jgi:hypothetical protein
MLGLDGRGDLLHRNFGFGAHAGIVEQGQGELQGLGLSRAAEGAENEPEVGIAMCAGEQLSIVLDQFGVRMGILFTRKANQTPQRQPAQRFSTRLAINAG